MNKHHFAGLFFIFLAALAICSGCATEKTSPVMPESTTITSPQSQHTNLSVVEANNQFALDLYSNLGDDSRYVGKNLFFSPFSISTVMAIAYEGAAGTTADEIQSVFHFPKDDPDRRRQFLRIYSEMNQGDNNYTLRMANALWSEQNHPFLPGYIQLAQGFYQTKLSSMDFANNPENSRSEINRWIEEKTSNKIKDLVPAGMIDRSTRLVITNAIYFRGTWVHQFNPRNTKDADFTISSGDLIKVPMMTQIGSLNYTETDRYQVLELPYEHSSENALSMMILLPKNKDLGSVEKSPDAAEIASLKNDLSATKVEVYLPRFSMETEYSLSQTLGSMGMPTAFTCNADFSGMDGSRNLSIQGVVHKAFVNVDEEGTEAAAATAAVIHLTSVEYNPIFRADHPFLFIIQDQDNGNILFIGRVMNPNG